ncbi:breast carcinoma-amplified sequence 1 isoform X5 [Pipistrellus kuhlii]|uniref:breast carcinoma-amplified sequence 1 isoform X5 n=1 Tax=Pipistrellus kuhlii TaxID=59472 RepID=UPI001E26F7A0|nr:breast carcinoma-amplified sequence 1 isoform X5 [Pipistrellus kuhlii]
MGNQMSVPQRAEEQENDSETDAHAVASKRDCVRNGTPVMVSTYTVQLYDEVDLEIRVQEDSVAASSPKTVDTSAVAAASGKNPGKEAKPGAPAAKSHFFLPLSRPVPGRAGDRGEDSSEPGRPDVSVAGGLGHKGASDSMALRPAAAQGPGPHKSPGRTPADHHGLAAPRGPAPLPPESGGAAPAKPKDSGFFNKLFKLDKGQEKAPTVSHQEAEGAAPEDQAFDIPGFPVPAQDVPAERDIAEGVDKGQEVTPVSCSLPRDPEELEIAKEDPQTTAITEDNNSVMSFFKTLVSSNKAETKKDLEDTACKAETVCDGQAGQKTSEIQAKGAKKKHLNSPRLGLSFRRFFRHKGAEKSPARSADLKSDKATVVPQETQGAAKNPTPTETAKEGAKQKGGPPSLPLSKLFWKKSVKEDSIPTGAEENSVKGDGGTAHSEEINGKDSSYQTPHSPQKAPAPPEPEPAGAGASQKGKEGSAKDKDKDKKTVAESNKPRNNKQEAKEPAPCACVEPAVAVAMVQANTLQNGDRLQKRPEKRRQSLGGFFKGLGPKRMMDAQVQTDPVSIGPVGKPKCTGKCVFSKAKKWPFPRIELLS